MKLHKVSSLLQLLKGAISSYQQACLVGAFSQRKAHFFFAYKFH